MTNKWIAGARPRTLPAAVVPVLVGTACAAGRVPGGLIWWRAVAAMVVALAIQIGTNYANDYSDGKRGTDDPGQRVGPADQAVHPEQLRPATADGHLPTVHFE